MGQQDNHPTSFIDPSGFDGYYFDFNMDYSFDFSPDIQGFDLSIPNMSIGTGGYYVPDVQMSVGAPDMTYAGGKLLEAKPMPGEAPARVHSMDTTHRYQLNLAMARWRHPKLGATRFHSNGGKARPIGKLSPTPPSALRLLLS